MNINYNPVFIFPEIDVSKPASTFFKLLISFQIVSILVIIIIFYPMELIFLYNYLLGRYSLSTADQNSITAFKEKIDNLSLATISCDTNNFLKINNITNALDINKNTIVCTQQIRELYNL